MKPTFLGRRLSLKIIGVAIGAALSADLLAAIEWGKEYVAVKSPQPSEVAGKIEVLEFFSYTCPHCFKLEGTIGPWSKRLPADVAFHRMPVASSESTLPLARVYFALEAMGVLEKAHLQVFDAFQEQGVPLNREKTLFEWIGKQGLDVKQFEDTYRSFGVQTKVSRAKQLSQAFDINAVPTLVVGGKYLTSASLVGSKDALPKVLDGLLALVRKETRGRV